MVRDLLKVQQLVAAKANRVQADAFLPGPERWFPTEHLPKGNHQTVRLSDSQATIVLFDYVMGSICSHVTSRIPPFQIPNEIKARTPRLREGIRVALHQGPVPNIHFQHHHPLSNFGKCIQFNARMNGQGTPGVTRRRRRRKRCLNVETCRQLNLTISWDRSGSRAALERL